MIFCTSGFAEERAEGGRSVLMFVPSPSLSPQPGSGRPKSKVFCNGFKRIIVTPVIILISFIVSGQQTCLEGKEKVPRIVGIERLDDTAILNVGNGDNFHMTWATDGRQFTGLCDGTGFKIPNDTGEYNNTRVYTIHGDAPRHHFEYLKTYPFLGQVGRFYGFGILAIDEHVYQYCSTFLSTPGGSKPLTMFIGAKLTYSPDNGKSWRNQDGTPLHWEGWEDRNSDNMVFWKEPDGAFSLLTILQMGRNYEDNRDGYVYVYAPNGYTVGTMNQLVMFRVPKEKILDRSAYEYFVSRNPDGTAKWNSKITGRLPVHTFPSGWVNTNSGNHPYAWHPSVVYIKPLGQYMMTTWGTGEDKGEDVKKTPREKWFPKLNYLGFWTAPQPWGPWTQIHEDTAWIVNGDKENRNYQPQISPKWIAPDGKSFWLVWTNFRGGYAFNCQKVLIKTE